MLPQLQVPPIDRPLTAEEVAEAYRVSQELPELWQEFLQEKLGDFSVNILAGQAIETRFRGVRTVQGRGTRPRLVVDVEIEVIPLGRAQS
jgi:hypothetical protein